jgi:hypothetical protein
LSYAFPAAADLTRRRTSPATVESMMELSIKNMNRLQNL